MSREAKAEEPKIKMVCRDCGSDDVRQDAYAAWDDTEQDWVLAGTYDDAFCCACEGEARLEIADLVTGEKLEYLPNGGGLVPAHEARAAWKDWAEARRKERDAAKAEERAMIVAQANAEALAAAFEEAGV